MAILNHDLKFIGSHTDIYGYGHESLRGNTTRDLMNRLGSIVASDNYLLNIGNNDWRYISEAETVNNIKQITSSLLAKKSGATVFVMTLLPRKDSNDARNQRVNQQLRDWIAAQGNSRIKLLDLDRDFRALSNWSSLLSWDGVQPTPEGYAELAKIINKYIPSSQTSPTPTTSPSGPSSVSFTLGMNPAPVVTST
ncbi:SGNH/GDSL hydrolase family protein, partial [Thermithiobacillus plumbiphilus]